MAKKRKRQTQDLIRPDWADEEVIGRLPARRPDETEAEWEEMIRWVMVAAEYGLEHADQQIRQTRPDLAEVAERLDWRGRYRAWLRGRAARLMEAHQQRIESLRARFLLAAPVAAEIVIQLAQGINPPDPELGKPQVPARTRLAAAERVLEFAGLAVPRRVELTADDAAVAVARAQQNIARLDSEKLQVLRDLLDIRPPVIDGTAAEEVKK